MNVLFDLDGTLTDPGDGFVACVSYALDKLDCRRYADHEIRCHVGPPLEETLARLLDDHTTIARAVAFYRERYGSVGYLENRVYPEIETALQLLRARGARTFVATSKPTVYAERILGHFGLSKYFDAIHGSGLDGKLAGKTELVAHVLKREGITKGVMVGDRAQDIAAARACGLHPIGVLWGYGSREELSAAGAAALCASPSDLPSLIA